MGLAGDTTLDVGAFFVAVKFYGCRFSTDGV